MSIAAFAVLVATVAEAVVLAEALVATVGHAAKEQQTCTSRILSTF